jgi:hypothetical protein
MKKVFVLLLMVSSCCGYAQTASNSKIFESFKKDRFNSILPDFSYAGYKYGEVALPEPSYKVFDVTSFGAVPNDDKSDRTAIEAAIRAAEKNGSGIVFFPPGRFLVNEDGDPNKSITIARSRIILRGSGPGKGGTELFMKNTLVPADTKLMWSAPAMFSFNSFTKDTLLGTVTAPEKVGSFKVTLTNTGDIQPGDWISLHLNALDTNLVRKEIGSMPIDTVWTTMLKKEGVIIRNYHEVKKVEGNVITLVSPIAYAIDPKHNWEVYKFGHIAESGAENIAFVGNFHDKFVHHRSWIDDSGWKLFNTKKMVHSWLKNCSFTDCNVGVQIRESSNITVINCEINGTPAHEAMSSYRSMNVFMGKNVDHASMDHSIGVDGYAMNTVIWRSQYPPTTCFESHSYQPRNTLLDVMEGGLLEGHAGGAVRNHPNHMQNLIFWNYKQTNPDTAKVFNFWMDNDRWFRIAPPIIVGMHGTTVKFKPGQVKYLESFGKPVTPESLYEAQLLLRLGKLPDWLVKLKATGVGNLR